MEYLDTRKCSSFIPRFDEAFGKEHERKKNFFDLTSNYWSRQNDKLPILYEDSPWTMHQDYSADMKLLAKINDNFDKQYMELTLLPDGTDAAKRKREDLDDMDDSILLGCFS